MNDQDFYGATQTTISKQEVVELPASIKESPKASKEPFKGEDEPSDSQIGLIREAAQLSQTHSSDGKVYIVRGQNMFVVHSRDIQVTQNQDGTRSVTIKNASMIKYDENGQRITG